MSVRRIAKALKLVRHSRFVRAILRQRVAAAVEHLEPIRLTAAETLIDAGANKGQFSLAFRVLRPHAHIIAFEPLPEAAETYARLFAGDGRVRLERVALSDQDGQARFHVADRSDSSSLLAPGPGQAAAFGVRGSGVIDVAVRRLDGMIDPASLARPILLKIDVQGAELLVLRGIEQLDLIDFVYIELSMIELYDAQAMFEEVASFLFERGFTVAGVFNQVATRQFGPTQADVLFKRSTRGCDSEA